MKWTSRQRLKQFGRTEAGEHAKTQQVTAQRTEQKPSRPSSIWSSFRQPRFLAASGATLAFLAGTALFIHDEIQHTQVWQQVYTNGQYVGLVPNQQRVLTEMQRTANGYNIQLRFTPVRLRVANGYDWQSVAQLPVHSYAIELNGQAVTYVATRRAATEALTTVKYSLTPATINPSASVHFNGTVAIKPAVTGVANVLSTQAAITRLTGPATPTLSSRAEDMLAANQSMLHTVAATSEGKLKTDSVLQVIVKENEVQTVTTPYSVHYVKTDQLGKGDTKVVSKGHSGSKREDVSLTYVDGTLSSRAVTSETVLLHPKTQVEDVGTNSGIAGGSWGLPVTGYVVTSPFGPRYLYGRYEFHPGIDLAVPQGTPVYATNNGVVESAGWNSGGYGNWVLINNGNGIETVFGHNSRVVAHAGETVHTGQLIAYSGQTGDATGPHVHYEVRKNGTAINPVPYM